MGQLIEDYDLVRRAIERISRDWQDQPQVDALAASLGVSEVQLTRTFRRFCGLTPKAFLQAVTIDHGRRLLDDGLPLLEASLEMGLSSPGRLHDLFVTHDAMSPGDYKTRGAGLTIRYGWHETPFGEALVMATERGLCGMAFVMDEGREVCFADMASRWPNAGFVADPAATAPFARHAFMPGEAKPETPLNVVLIGTDFEVRVWTELMTIPLGEVKTYGEIADAIGKPKAARAVGAAIGRNPVSFVVPCHRVIGSSGALTGYHWGLTRKRAILGWEAARVGAMAEVA